MAVQALPSSQGVPFGMAGLEQAPVDGLQTPTSWQASSALHTTGLDPTQLPLWQASLVVQADRAPATALSWKRSTAAVCVLASSRGWM